MTRVEPWPRRGRSTRSASASAGSRSGLLSAPTNSVPSRSSHLPRAPRRRPRADPRWARRPAGAAPNHCSCRRGLSGRAPRRDCGPAPLGRGVRGAVRPHGVEYVNAQVTDGAAAGSVFGLLGELTNRNLVAAITIDLPTDADLTLAMPPAVRDAVRLSHPPTEPLNGPT